MTTGFEYIFILIIILVVVLILFAVVDRLLKGGTAKKSSTKKPVTKTVETPKESKETPKEIKVPTVMKIYNSELADDLNAILKESGTNKSQRLQMENHVNKESNISKYIQSKNYQSFDFGVDQDERTDEDADKPLTFTRDDYKRFMALSNIDDKK